MEQIIFNERRKGAQDEIPYHESSKSNWERVYDPLE